MLLHASVRDFKAEPLSADVKELLLKAAQSGASSNFLQAYSIIEIADNDLRRELAKISGSDDYVNQTGVFIYLWLTGIDKLRFYGQKIRM